MASEQEPDEVYHPEDAIANGTRACLVMGGAGLTLSAIQNTLQRSNLGGWGVFSRTGVTAATFIAMGATFGFARSASANLREKHDYWNPTIGGFLAGAVGGLRFRTFPAVLGFGAGLAILEGGLGYIGGDVNGFFKGGTVDEYERKQELRKNRRRPIEEVLGELGEGRGIYGPGYRERRADRIKETYGIDVPRT